MASSTERLGNIDLLRHLFANQRPARMFATTRLLRLFLLVLLTGIGAQADADAVCARRPDAAPALAALQHVMAHGRFIAYQPVSLRVVHGQLTQADPASIEADLRTLRPTFDGLITYGVINGAERIPDIAARLGYRAVILGIWDIADPVQVANVVAAVKRNPGLVVGVSVGNEVLFAKHATHDSMLAAISTIRRAAPRLPLAVSEPFHLFDDPDSARVLAQSDFLLPIVHPVFQPWYHDAPERNSAEFVVRIVERLAQQFCGPILVKETGAPTAPRELGFSEERQAALFRELRQVFPPTAQRAFAYFSAFDASWRVHDVTPVPGHHPEEAWWGIFSEARVPRQAARELPALEK